MVLKEKGYGAGLGVDEGLPAEHAQRPERRDLGHAVGLAELRDRRELVAGRELSEGDLLAEVGGDALGRPYRLALLVRHAANATDLIRSELARAQRSRRPGR